MPHDITPRRLAAEAKASAGGAAKADAPVYPVVINTAPKVYPPVRTQSNATTKAKQRLAFTADDKARLDSILHAAVDSRQVNALTFAVSDAEGELYFNCAGERVFGELDKGQVDERTSECYRAGADGMPSKLTRVPSSTDPTDTRDRTFTDLIAPSTASPRFTSAIAQQCSSSSHAPSS